MNKALRDQVMQLPPAERLELADDLLESVSDAGDDFDLTDERKRSLIGASRSTSAIQVQRLLGRKSEPDCGRD